MRSVHCPEPDGERKPEGTGFRTMHELMLDAAGHCPWCGETESKESES